MMFAMTLASAFMTSGGKLTGPGALIFLMASVTFAMAMGPGTMSKSSLSSISGGLTTGVPLSRLLKHSFHLSSWSDVLLRIVLLQLADDV